MTNSKSTKRALVSSALAVFLCVAMLIGTTFAWFTDTASTAVNKIQAGTLDVALEMYENGEWVNAEGKTLNFKAADGRTDILWEPGCTYELPTLRIVNNGNLVLKYEVVITGINGNEKLNEVIEWKYSAMFANGTYTYPADMEGNILMTGVMYPGDESSLPDYMPASGTFKIIGHMKEAAGNEYQGLSIDGISITVVATQAQYEYDSNGNTYDKDATLPSFWDGRTETAPTMTEGVYHITNAAEFAQYINELNNNPQTGAHRYDGANVVLDCNIDLGGAVLTASNEGYMFNGSFDGNGHTVSNFTVKRTDGEYYTGLFSVYMQDATIKNLTVENGTVISNGKQVAAIVPSVYDNATVENCHTVNCIVSGDKKVGAVAGYAQTGAAVKNCSAKGCSVYASNNSVADTNLFGYDNGGTFTNNTDKGGNTLSYGAALIAVSSATELTNAIATNTAKVNVLLNKDVTFTSDWTPIDIGFYGDYRNVTNLTINGNGHTISGLNSALVEKISGNHSLTISNLTVKSATINNSSYTNGMGNGILVGYVENGSVTLKNCNVVDSSITESSVAAAALIGYISNGTAINITDCSVKNTVVNGDSAAGFVGYAQQANITVSGCKVTGSTFTGETTNKQGAYFGTVNVGTIANVSNTTADTTALVGRILSTGAVNYN